MSPALSYENGNEEKQASYEAVLKQVSRFLESEGDIISNLSNTAALLYSDLHLLWAGFYIRKGSDLVLGPFQGPPACTRIPVEPAAKGCCGICAARCETIVVPDVGAFSAHIACSPEARSEIVVPWVVGGRTRLVLDLDSSHFGAFDDCDQRYLERLIALFADRYPYGI